MISAFTSVQKITRKIKLAVKVTHNKHKEGGKEFYEMFTPKRLFEEMP